MFSHLTKDFLGNKQSYSIGIIFISVGLLIGSWATFIPFVKAKFDLDDAQLGLLLLSLPFGALSMNSLGASLVRKIGMRKTTLMGLSAMLVSFSILLWSPVIPMLSVMLFLGGSSLSVTNVGMNTCVNAIEHQQKVKIMSTNHGMFSIGLMMGSILSSFFGALEIQPGVFMVFLTVILLFSMLFASTNINKIEDEKIESEGPKSKFSLPKGSFLLMILISICINVTEGTMADWSAVYMRDIVKTSSYFEGWGLAGYSLFMALGRFLGDKIIPMYGANKVLKYGGLLSILGLTIAIFLPFTFSTIAGFALVGAGVSCGAPILYASAARAPGMAKGSGLAMLNTFAMGGFLFGPVLIGFISKTFSLPFALGVVGFLGIAWVFNARRVKLF
jgi:MFS family permease